MVGFIREHVVVSAAVLAVVALGLTFAAVLEVVPPTLLPDAPPWVYELIPHLNAAIALVALGVLWVGFRAIRRRDVRSHRRAMLAALGLFGLFLTFYLYNLMKTGTHPFGGPDIVYYYVYLPILVLHIALAIICIPLLCYVALLGLVTPTVSIPSTNHARIARPALLLWATSFALGVVVYLYLYILY